MTENKFTIYKLENYKNTKEFFENDKVCPDAKFHGTIDQVLEKLKKMKVGIFV